MPVQNLPREIYDFFDETVGRSLIIKGHAGTGKTILSLTLLEEIADIENSFYFSTRVSNQSLYSQFDWLKEKDIYENLIDASIDFLKVIYPEEEAHPDYKKTVVSEEENRKKIEMARKVLQRFPEEGEEIKLPEHVSRANLISLQGGEDIRELEEIYNRVDARLPEPSLIIIDSLESLVERYSVEATELIKTLHKDLVEVSGVRLVIVLEAEEATKWDYLVDGVVTLKSGEKAGRRVRYMVLNKLRGVKIESPVYLFTLNDGRYKYFSHFKYQLPKFEEEHTPIKDGEGTEFDEKGFFSTGSDNLDDLLGGGYIRDSLVVFEINDSVPFTGQMYLFGSVLENFLSQGRGALVIPSSIRGKRVLLDWAKDQFGKDVVNRLKVMDLEEKRKDKSYELTLGDYQHEFREAYKELKFRTKGPILTICDWLKLEHSVVGKELENIDKAIVTKEMLDLMRDKSDLTIGLMGPSFVFSEKSRYMSDIYLKVFMEYNSLLMYGEKPNTGIYNIYLPEEKHPKTQLTPLV